MADSATWADDVRGERKNGPWHYIDIPRGSKRGPVEGFCGAAGCVTKAIREQLAILKDTKADAAKRAEALRYIIHFVGDLHQPLHTTTNADQGGNCVPMKYFRRNAHEHNHSFSPNLHAFGIRRLWNATRKEQSGGICRYARHSVRSGNRRWQKAGIHVEDWAWEGYDFAATWSTGT